MMEVVIKNLKDNLKMATIIMVILFEKKMEKLTQDKK